METELTQLGALGLVSVIAIREFFGYLKARKIESSAFNKELCDQRHKYIDDNIIMIKENHLKHMEAELKKLSEDQIRIFTILDERLPAKICH